MLEDLSLLITSYTLLDHMPMGVCVLNDEFEVIYWNNCLETWTGISRSRITGSTIGSYFPHFEEPKYAKRIQSVLDGGPPMVFSSQLHPHIIPAPLPDGRMRIQQTTVTSVRQDQNHGFYALMVIQEVTELFHQIQKYRRMRDQALEENKERLRAEAALATQAEDLKRSNQELEHFAYVASHDLQEPLRKITNFSQLLAKRYQGRLDAKADKYINYVVDGSARMRNLIQDLLAYSRAGSGELVRESTDLEDVLAEMQSDLEMVIRESDAKVTHDPLPTLAVNSGQIKRLLQNLIGNAIKYCDSETPRVHIGAEKKNGDWEFTVRDNGIGMDPKSFERIFLIFQRLHTREEYSGTGVGLAICKKIVEIHGGRIWVESELGAGSSFYFTLPTVNESNLK